MVTASDASVPVGAVEEGPHVRWYEGTGARHPLLLDRWPFYLILCPLQYTFILLRAIEHTHNNNLFFYLVNQVKDNIVFDNQLAVATAT